MRQLIAISIGTIFINNFVLSRFLGLCPFIGVSKKLDSVLGMGLAVTFVMTLASMVTYLIYNYVLVLQIPKLNINIDLAFLRIVSFILVIAALVQLVEIVLKKMVPTLYDALGIYLPLITTNCAILGLAILNIDDKNNLAESIVFGFGAALGFTLALVIMAGIRERLETSDLPKPLQGIPIALIVAGLLSLAFLGFQNLVKF